LYNFDKQKSFLKMVVDAGIPSPLALMLQLIMIGSWPQPVQSQQSVTTAPSLQVPFNIEPGQPDQSCLISRGAEQIAQGHFAAAEALFKEFTRIHPQDPTGYFWLGKVADETGRTQDAFHSYVESLNRAKAIGMDSEELRLNLGNTLLKLGYYKEATYDFERALEINSKNGFAHYNLAKLFLVTGQDSKALSELDYCSKLGMNDPHVSLFRAWALKRLGQLEEARREAQRYLEQTGPGEPKELQDFARSQF
jgi:tetratricopeptide (TPR) repeat protein